jgi:DNA mismatch repair protein MutL
MSAYEGLLIDDTFPFYVLFINIEPQRLDINVHPTKTEVKFDDERTVYAVINAAVKQALGKHHVTPSIDFDLDANYTLPGRMSLEAPEKPKKNAISNLKKQDYISPKKDWREWEKLFTQHIQQNIENVDESQTVSSSLALTLESAANKLDEYEQKENRKITFQIHNKYIISQLKSGMMMIDQQAAHEQVLYERYLKSLENRLGISQQLLFPKQITLSFADVILLTELESDMTAMGFVFESKDKNTIILKGVPADTLHYVEEKELLESIIEQFKQNRNELNVNRHENMAMSIAKRTAIRNGTALTATEMNMLIDQLFACQSPHYSFEGKKIIVTLNLADLEKLFQS